MVEKGFELSEASNTPVMLELRIRACHVQGSFVAKDNRIPRFSRKRPIHDVVFDPAKSPLPPYNYQQERHKVETRWPAAVNFIRAEKLNETFDGPIRDLGIITQGGVYNAVLRALAILGLADAYGNSLIPIYTLNVTYPLVPEEVTQFCAGKRAVLLLEEGQPAFIEESMHAVLRRAELHTRLSGKDYLPLGGEYTGEVVLTGIARWVQSVAPSGVDLDALRSQCAQATAPRLLAIEALGAPVPPRPPGFCVGCPERPVFTAMKLVERETLPFYVSADVGCHSFSILPPFNMGSTVMGYGLGLASNSSLTPIFDRRTVTIMGDGGFWHSGLTSGIGSAVFNKDDGILVIMKNGYTSATGTQSIPSSPLQPERRATHMSIEKALAGVGVKWVKSVYTYHVSEMAKTLREAMTTGYKGLKVIIADAECQLERQRRIRPQVAAAIAAGERVVRTRFGVDDDVCTGDHSCIRLSGCPSLTVKPNPDPLRTDPVAHVDNGCVGCGLCGEVAQAAVLCPSFFRADIVQNANAWDRFIDRVRNLVIGWLAPADTPSEQRAA
jgi:indolepyruvate ferredoxin oxidoreductase alpha subunit